MINLRRITLNAIMLFQRQKCCAWLSLVALINLSVHTSAYGDVRFTHLLQEANQNGDGIGATSSITQDHHGFMWIGGENGVIKYDGINTKHYFHDPSQPSLTSNYTRSTIVDHKGVVWVGTDLGLCYLDTSIDNFRCFTQQSTDGPAGLTDNTIFAIEVGPDNSLYIGTGNGLNILNPERTNFSHIFYHALGQPDHLLSSVSSLMLDGDKLWVGSGNRGYGILDLTNHQTRLFPNSENDSTGVSVPNIRSFLKDTHDRIWISTYGEGVNRLDSENNAVRVYRSDPDDPKSIGSDVIWKGFQDSQGTIWFATDHGGLARYNEETDDFTNYRHDPYDPHSLSSDQVRTIFEDISGNLWIGTFPQGVNYIKRSAQYIEHWTLQPTSDKSLTHSAILSFLEDRDGHIWIGTENGLNEYEPKTQTFHHYLPKKGTNGFLQAGPVLSLEEDPSGDLWVGTWSGGLHRLNRKSKTFQHFPINKNDPNALHDSFIWKVVWDKKKQRLFLASEGGGLSIYDPASDTFSHFLHDPYDSNSISANFVLNLLLDDNGSLWLATTDGLDRFDEKGQRFIHYKSVFTTIKTGDPINTIRIRSMAMDYKQRLWVGSQNNGIFVVDPAAQSTKQLNLDNGLPSNYISSMVIDNLNQLWATTPSGAARIQIDNLDDIRVFNKRDGLAGNHYNRDATLLDHNGMVYLGGIDGVSRFYPQQVDSTLHHTPVRIHDFRIFNQSIKPADLKSPLKQPIMDTKKLTIQHQHSMITFEYIALNYAAPNSFEYAYKLAGFDPDWNYVGNKRFATYTNLNHGNYTFLVKAKPENGTWPAQATQIAIEVLPPPWLSIWAYLLYVVASLSFIVFLVRLQYKRLELITEKSLNSELIRLNRIKDAFLANTSHELRTPLNGIIGIAESVYEEAKDQIHERLLDKLHLIALSGKRLSGLINDILDYTKLGQSKLNIYPKPINLYHIAVHVIKLLQPLADEKAIRICNNLLPTTPSLFADENRLQQILLNLIGNGIKYTELGSVSVSAEIKDQYIEIHVIDTGIGIDQQHHAQIFNAFHQVEENSTLSKGGTGLGLAVTKELIELHGGSVWIETGRSVGSDFAFRMPIYRHNTHTARSQIPKRNTSPTLEDDVNTLLSPNNKLAPPVNRIPICAPPENANTIKILVVDDDPVNRLVLSSMLKLHHYQVIEASDGAAALKAVALEAIDLVILDVMMPKISGFEVCRILRETHPIHKMPILFLTAKKIDEDVSVGFSVGGNEFLTKPVSKYEILPRIANHVRLLQIFRNLLVESNTVSE